MQYECGVRSRISSSPAPRVQRVMEPQHPRIPPHRGAAFPTMQRIFSIQQISMVIRPASSPWQTRHGLQPPQHRKRRPQRRPRTIRSQQHPSCPGPERGSASRWPVGRAARASPAYGSPLSLSGRSSPSLTRRVWCVLQCDGGMPCSTCEDTDATCRYDDASSTQQRAEVVRVPAVASSNVNVADL